MFCGSFGRYLGRSLPWSKGMLFGWGFSRSREVRLELGGVHGAGVSFTVAGNILGVRGEGAWRR